eukprot:scaffold133722_cov26-Tisochrysis_lutea.AAC.8
MKDARAPHMTIGFPSSPSVPWPYGVTEPWHTRCAMGGPCAEITQRPRGRRGERMAKEARGLGRLRG